jgi:hypothetical protein
VTGAYKTNKKRARRGSGRRPRAAHLRQTPHRARPVHRITRRVNRLLRRRGRFWADRWHGRDLEGPRQVRNALVDVLQNHKKHSRSASLDPLSSAGSFDGFCERATRSISQHWTAMCCCGEDVATPGWLAIPTPRSGVPAYICAQASG